MALFENTKRKVAREDSGDEGKIYTLIMNSNNKISGTNNSAQYNINFSFLPRNFQYYKMNYTFQSSGGVFKDQIIEFGGTTSGTTLTIVTYDTAISGQICALNSRLIPLVSTDYLPSNTYITANGTGTGQLGTYVLSQSPTTDFVIKTATGTLTSGSNTLTFSSAQTNLIGMFLVHSGGTSAGTRVVSGSGTSWIINKPALTTSTNQTMNLYPAFQAKINYATARLNLDFGCKSYMHDDYNDGQSSFLGIAQRVNQGTASNHFNIWWEQFTPQILNIHNSTGQLNLSIYNGDDVNNNGNQLLTDTTLQGIPTSDFVNYTLAISFTPILSSHIDTQSF